MKSRAMGSRARCSSGAANQPKNFLCGSHFVTRLFRRDEQAPRGLRRKLGPLQAESIQRATHDFRFDAEALAAFRLLAENEGILCAFESAHALALALKLAEQEPESAILVGLSGRGDKDVAQAQQLLGPSA